MPNFDFNEIVKKTYKKESTDIKDTEYYESLKVCKNLEKPVSVEEDKDDNCAKDDKATKDDYNNLKDILSIVTSVIAIIAALYAAISRFINDIYSINLAKFYNISADLFDYNRNFYFILSLAIYAFTVVVLLSPFNLRDKWISKKVDRFESFLWSLAMSLYVWLISYIILISLLIKFNHSININYIYIGSLIFWIFLWRFYYYIITDAPKFWRKSRDDNKSNSSTNKEAESVKLSKSRLILYVFYIIFIIIIILCIAAFAISNINLDPKNKMSYEILKDEKEYNVIIGYKDDMAITMSSKNASDPETKILRFESNQYKLQDLKDKIIIYKTFDKVIPYGGSVNNKDSNESSDETGN